jgi:hypothetical protein
MTVLAGLLRVQTVSSGFQNHAEAADWGSILPAGLHNTTFSSIYLNGLNFCIKGRVITLFKVEDKVEAMAIKSVLWLERFKKGVFELFPTLIDFRTESDVDLS